MTKLAEQAGLPALQLQEADLRLTLQEVPQGAFPSGLFPLGQFPAEFFAEVEGANRIIRLLFSFYTLFYLFPCAPALPIFIIFGGGK